MSMRLSVHLVKIENIPLKYENTAISVEFSSDGANVFHASSGWKETTSTCVQFDEKMELGFDVNEPKLNWKVFSRDGLSMECDISQGSFVADIRQFKTSKEGRPQRVVSEVTGIVCEFTMMFIPNPQKNDFFENKCAGWPPGMQRALEKTLDIFPSRFFICDDSGDMKNKQDGHRVVVNEGVMSERGCSRKTEMEEFLEYHIDLLKYCGIPSFFLFLSAVENEEPVLTVAEEVKEALSPDDTGATSTPLCAAINRAIHEIEVNGLQRSLLKDQKVLVVIATAGKATDGDPAALREALARLSKLQVKILIRLCSDDEQVICQWNKLDGDRLDVDVLDNYFQEAAEVELAGNDFVTYGLPLHQLREFGCCQQVLNLLDQEELSDEYITKLCALILNRADLEALMTASVEDFWASVIHDCETNLSPVFCPTLSTAPTYPLQPWIKRKAPKKADSASSPTPPLPPAPRRGLCVVS